MSSVQTFSGHSLISELLINQLEGKLKQPLSVVIDVPCGYAFKGIELVKKHLNSLIITNNPCGEYIEDLWDCKPTILIAKQVSLDEFIFFAQQAAQGKSHKICSWYVSPLTEAERNVLRLCVTRKTIAEVSEFLSVSSGTIKNQLCSIYSKLNLRGLSELCFYYFGMDKITVNKRRIQI